MWRTLAVAMGAVALGCGGPTPQDLSIRQPTMSYRFTIRADSAPPYANEWIPFTVTVADRKTDQPVQGGEGQIYGQYGPGGRPYTWDSFVYGPEVGTYHARLRFVVPGPNAGAWQMGLRFHRDSISPIEVTNWQQQVLPERDLPAKPPS